MHVIIKRKPECTYLQQSLVSMNIFFCNANVLYISNFLSNTFMCSVLHISWLLSQAKSFHEKCYQSLFSSVSVLNTLTKNSFINLYTSPTQINSWKMLLFIYVLFSLNSNIFLEMLSIFSLCPPKYFHRKMRCLYLIKHSHQ